MLSTYTAGPQDSLRRSHPSRPVPPSSQEEEEKMPAALMLLLLSPPTPPKNLLCFAWNNGAFLRFCFLFYLVVSPSGYLKTAILHISLCLKKLASSFLSFFKSNLYKGLTSPNPHPFLAPLNQSTVAKLSALLGLPCFVM
uniref:Uncharacterized protein n=1 Tax=Micrurus carvalhoi TaxID=3147026 RepID=A0A2H6NB45_9SAUR